MGFGRKSKKGNVTMEGLTVLIVVTIFALASIFGYMIFDQMNADIQANPAMSASATATSGDLHGKFPALFDNLFLMMFVLFTLFALVSAYMIDSQPLMFALALILLVGLFIATPLVANAFDDIVRDPVVSAYADSFPLTSWVMRNIMQMIIAIGFMIMLVLYVKFKG